MQRKKNTAVNLRYYSDRLQKKLSMLAASPATIIEAPSGYGKTTAMRDYLEGLAKNGDDVYWFTAVDEAPMALYRRLCGEMEKIDFSASERLRKTDFPNAFTIGEVCDALRSIKCGSKTWLVIDNFQFFCAILPPSFLAALLDHGGDELRIVILTRKLGQNFLSAIAGRGILHITAPDLQWNAEDIHRYFSLAGLEISKALAEEVRNYTDGWIIAVHLQLCAYQETGAFSDKAVLQLMDNLIWDKMTKEQQYFFMRLSPFANCTIQRMCGILKCDILPDYAVDSLSIPFVRCIVEQQRYELHAILLELGRIKRRERGEAFEKECLVNAGDLCRDEGNIAEALVFFTRIKDYERILSLNLSQLVRAEIGDSAFYDIALDIAQSCPANIRRGHPFSMLSVAWAVRLLDNSAVFGNLMDELDGFLPENGPLRAEWLLLSAYLHYPCLDEMLPPVQKAAIMFEGNCSLVILPEDPWAFYEYFQLTAFYTQVGAADHEAEMLEKFIAVYSRLTAGHGKGADALFRAELAFLRCETAKAEIFAYKAVFLAENKQQKIIQIGAARLLASIALLKADAEGWQRAVGALEHAASGSAQNTLMFRMVLDVVRGTLLAELRDYALIAVWLQNYDLGVGRLPISITKNALAVHLLYLMGQGEYTRLIGLGQALPLDKYTVFTEHIHFFLLAVGFSSLGDRAQAAKCLERSAKKGLPDGLMHYFAGFSRLSHGLPDELIKNSYPHLLARFKDYREQYIAGWFTLHNAIVANELPSGLTGREREIALLAAEGLRNNEIAEKLFVSENTVRAHLRAIYQKLDIDRRAKLAKKLK